MVLHGICLLEWYFFPRVWGVVMVVVVGIAGRGLGAVWRARGLTHVCLSLVWLRSLPFDSFCVYLSCLQPVGWFIWQPVGWPVYIWQPVGWPLYLR